jgi:ribulose 1,5-bisphosphate synthetase/thiazole synthase
MSTLIPLNKTARLAGSYDVVVCGGGVAGFAAAVSAARAGMKTAIIERFNSFGGTATHGNVIPVSGFFHKEKRVVGGIGWELIQRLEAVGAAQVEMPKGHVSVNIELLKLEMQRMLLESGVALYLNSYITDTLLEAGKAKYVVFESKSGTEALEAECVIDATGDGDVCHLAGVAMQEKKEELQPMSMCFLLDGVDLTTDLMRDCIHHNGLGGKPSENRVIREYLLTRTDKLSQFGGPWFNTLLRGNAVAVNMTRSAGDSTDRESQTQAELKMREDIFTAVELLREHFPEFKDAHVVSTPIMAGVRESRHILGEEMARAEEMLSGKRYPCEVAHCAHPMDIHSAKSSNQQLIRLEGAAYVPHGTLVPQGSRNLLVAGRCLCADQGAYASIRVQATLMSIGEAAGLMAAMHCATGKDVSALPEKELAESFAKRAFVL